MAINWIIGGFFIGIVLFIWGGLIISEYIEGFKLAKRTNTSKKSAFLFTTLEILKVVFGILLISGAFYIIEDIFKNGIGIE